MKRILSSLLIALLLFSGNVVSIFAEDDHVHEWSSWYVEEESTCIEHGQECRYCTVCGEEEYRDLPLAGHDWGSWETIRKATPYKKGLKVRTCWECEKEQTKSIPKRKLTSNQKKAVKVVTTYLKAAKKYNINKMNSCFKKRSTKYVYPVANINHIYKKNNKVIKWKMVDARGKGNTITVKVKVTRPDLYSRTYKVFYETMEWALYHPNFTEAQLTNKLLSKIKAKLDNYKPKTTTDTVTFKIVKSGKKWKIKSQTRAIVDIATGFYYEASDDAYDDLVEEYSY